VRRAARSGYPEEAIRAPVPSEGFPLPVQIQAIDVLPLAGDVYGDRLRPARAPAVTHAERVTISEMARQGASGRPPEVSDVRWYRAAGYAHILKQRAQSPQDPSGGEPALPRRSSRAAQAYQRTMESAATT